VKSGKEALVCHWMKKIKYVTNLILHRSMLLVTWLSYQGQIALYATSCCIFIVVDVFNGVD